MLWAKPVMLMTSYHTKDFVEEQKNGCPIGRLYIQMYIVRGRNVIVSELQFGFPKTPRKLLPVKFYALRPKVT